MLLKSASKAKARKLWLQFHLYIGLTAGFFFVVAGLTGSALVFYIEIDEWLHPELVLTTAPDQQSSLSYESIYLALKAAHPEREKSWRLELPDSDNRMITARYYKPSETAHLAFAPLQVWVNQYTGEVVKSRFWGEYLMTWIYDLHYSLLSDIIGRYIIAFFGLFFLASLLTGIYLWWPSKKNIKRAFTFKSGVNIKRKAYDIHKLSGVYGATLLLVIASTGTILNFPELKSVVNSLSLPFKPASTKSIVRSDSKRISLDKAVEIAQAQFPIAKVKWIVTPNNETGSYRINLRQPGEPSIRFPKTNVWVDQYSGNILAIRDVVSDGAGDTFLRWLHPLHSGEAFGLTGRIIVLLSGLIPLVLFYTGVLRWFQKRSASMP